MTEANKVANYTKNANEVANLKECPKKDDLDEFSASLGQRRKKREIIQRSNQNLQKTVNELKKQMELSEKSIAAARRDRDVLVNSLKNLQEWQAKYCAMEEKFKTLETTLENALIEKICMEREFSEKSEKTKREYEKSVEELKRDSKSNRESKEKADFEISVLQKKLYEKETSINDLSRKLQTTERKLNQEVEKMHVEYETRIIMLENELKENQENSRKKSLIDKSREPVRNDQKLDKYEKQIETMSNFYLNLQSNNSTSGKDTSNKRKRTFKY